ncbi:MAG: acyl-CoA dehydrogenase family protein [Burkholderiales bacterium]|nr:acyl-CoA dehydrogenase family protein [Burkholderiales bacterium]
MSDNLIEQTATRLFADLVDRDLLAASEAGEWPARLWQQVEDNGLTLALASEAAGGIGATWAEAYPILREIGYAQVPLPLAQTMIAALLLSAGEAAVPPGPIALIEDLRDARLAGDRLTARAERVLWAGHAGHVLAALGDELLLLDLQSGRGAQIAPARRNAAGEPEHALGFDGAPVLARMANPFPGFADPIRHLGALATSIAMIGALEFALEQSVQYANDRVQFGRPLAKHQAIQHPLALMAGDVAAARMAALIAASAAPDATRRDAGSAPFDIAVAKVRAGEAATRAISIAHQVHGAIGFTVEHRLNYATRRLMAWRAAHGSDAWWAGRLGRAAIGARAAGFWPALTQRDFGGKPRG